MTDSMSRRRFLVGGGAVLGAAALGGVLPRGWPGSAFLVPNAFGAVRLDTNNPLANFEKEGNQPFTASPAVLSLNDGSHSDLIVFFANDPDAALGTELDVFASFQVVTTNPEGADGGMRCVIADGLAKAVIAVCIIKDGQRQIGLAAGPNFTDPFTYPVSVQVNWTSPVTLRMRRTATGDGEIVEVNGVAPNPRAVLLAPFLASHSRGFPSVEFGTSVEASSVVNVTEFFSERPAAPVAGQLTFTVFRVHDVDATDRVRFRADFTLGTGSDGINPSTEPVRIKLSTPSGGQFYPPANNDFNPLNGFDQRGEAPRRRWELNASERTRTGIDRFDIDEDPNNSGAVFFRDARADLASIDFSNVNVEIGIGNDSLTGTAQLVERPPGSGRWREQ